MRLLITDSAESLQRRLSELVCACLAAAPSVLGDVRTRVDGATLRIHRHCEAGRREHRTRPARSLEPRCARAGLQMHSPQSSERRFEEDSGRCSRRGQGVEPPKRSASWETMCGQTWKPSGKLVKPNGETVNVSCQCDGPEALWGTGKWYCAERLWLALPRRCATALAFQTRGSGGPADTTFQQEAPGISVAMRLSSCQLHPGAPHGHNHP